MSCQRASVFGVVPRVETHGLLSGTEGTILRLECGSGPRGSPSPQVQLCTPIEQPRNADSSSLPLLWSLSYSIANPRLRTSPKIEWEFTREIRGQRPQARAPAAPEPALEVGTQLVPRKQLLTEKTLRPSQFKALVYAVLSPLLLILGYLGSGKSTSLSLISKVLLLTKGADSKWIGTSLDIATGDAEWRAFNLAGRLNFDAHGYGR